MICVNRFRPFILVFLIFISFNANAQDKVKIAVWGDSRENLDNAISEGIAPVLLNKITDWDFQIHTGDFTHDGKEVSWQKSLNYSGISKLFVKDKFYLCSSNHDAKDPESQANWDKHTAAILPVNSADSTTHFYAVHKGNVNVVFLDSYFTNSEVMQKWLNQYLSGINPNDWLIAVWHAVSYGDLTYKESYLNVCQPWIDSLYKHGCKFILNGHAHVYVRTKPLMPDESINEKKGIVTIINGTGGASWKEPVKQNPRIAYSPSETSFPTITFLTFKGNHAYLETVDCRPGKNLNVIDKSEYDK